MRCPLSIVLSLVIAATVVAMAQAQPSPVARIIAQEDARRIAHVQVSTASDGRSPDTRDAAAHSTEATADNRSPDTQDAAASAHSFPVPTVVVINQGGFDWADAGIGSAAALAVLLLAAGGLALRRDSRRPQAHG